MVGNKKIRQSAWHFSINDANPELKIREIRAAAMRAKRWRRRLDVEWTKEAN